MTLEERLLYIAEDPFGLCDKNSLRKIALEVRKMNDRIKQLETENDAANAEIERLTNKVAELYKGAEEQKQRIQRLEYAGDYLCAAAAFLGWHDKIEDWNKAKEAKP